MVAKRFMYLSAGVLMLALAYHLGAGTARAQNPGWAVVGFTSVGQYLTVMTDDGSIYTSDIPDLGSPPRLQGNFWGGATPAARSSLGQVKARFR